MEWKSVAYRKIKINRHYFITYYLLMTDLILTIMNSDDVQKQIYYLHNIRWKGISREDKGNGLLC